MENFDCIKKKSITDCKEIFGTHVTDGNFSNTQRTPIKTKTHKVKRGGRWIGMEHSRKMEIREGFLNI